MLKDENKKKSYIFFKKRLESTLISLSNHQHESSERNNPIESNLKKL